jgi:hypothetical protein
MYKTPQLFTSAFTLKQTHLQASKLSKTNMHRHKVIKNAKLIKAWTELKTAH